MAGRLRSTTACTAPPEAVRWRAMRIVILSRRRSLYSTRRLGEECGNLGHESSVVDPLKCVLYIHATEPAVLHNGRPITAVDAVIPRIGTVGTAYSIAVVRQFDLVGVPCVNDHGPIARARNKLGALQVLVQNGLPVPDTLLSRYPRKLDRLLKLVGGTPVILKLLRGTQGTGVILSESRQSVEAVLETIWSLGEDIMIQRYVEECRGEDLRILVLGGRVVTAMKRIAAPGEFRANIHRGALGAAVELPKEIGQVAVDAAKALGLGLAGVDILLSKAGPVVIEVNASPGFQGLEAATGVNVARAIVERAVELGRRRA